MDVSCSGPDCPWCPRLGPPTSVRIVVRDVRTGLLRWMTLSAAKAERLGLTPPTKEKR